VRKQAGTKRFVQRIQRWHNSGKKITSRRKVWEWEGMV